MFSYSEYELLLLKLGWHQVAQKLWRIKNNDTNSMIYMDFRTNAKGIYYCNG